jgi:hypothetical protein
MAVTKSVLKLSESEAVVKVAGTSAAATIVLDTDLLSSTQALHATIPTAANITGVQWSGATAGVVTVSRGSETIMTLQAAPAGFLDMSGQAMIPDSVNNTEDLVVTVSGGQAECWLRLRKVAGYVSKIETAAYGIYDDTTKVGE